jgi:hypothetical protein
VRTVHRAAVGDAPGSACSAAGSGRAFVARLDDAGLELDVTLERDPPPALPLVLVLALPRPKAMRRVLQTVATLGIKRLCLVAAWRVEKSYWESPLLAPARVADELVLGLEQGGDTAVPTVTLHRRFKPFCRGRGSGRRGGEPPAARASTAACPVSACRRHAGTLAMVQGASRREVGAPEAQDLRRCRSARASSARVDRRRSSAGSSDRRGCSHDPRQVRAGAAPDRDDHGRRRAFDRAMGVVTGLPVVRPSSS